MIPEAVSEQRWTALIDDVGHLLVVDAFVSTQDGQAMLWDLNEGKHLYTLDSGDIINALCFSPNRYWLCAATGPSIKIWVSLGDKCLLMRMGNDET